MARTERAALSRGRGANGGRARVLHVITNLGVGGAERLVVSAARGLPADRFDSAICCFTDRGPLATEAESAGIPVFCVGQFPSASHPAAFLRLLRIVRTFHPAIVHTHLQSPNLYGRLAARLAGVPHIVATEHNVYRGKAKRHVLVERWLAGSTDALIAVSGEVQQFLASQLQRPASSIRVVRNGVAAQTSSPHAARLRAGVPETGLVLSVVASLTAKKGHEHLLRAAEQLRSDGVECSLLLAGDGPDRARLAALAASLGVRNRVTFLGNVSNVADVLAASDIFVLPSMIEGMPLALLEAMFAGKPIVATAVGGVPEVIDSGVNGVLVRPGDAAALARAIAELAGNPERRRQLSARARDTAERRYSESAYLAALASVYDDLLDGRQG